MKAMPRIRSFRIGVSQWELDDLRDRLARTRTGYRVPGITRQERGAVPFRYLEDLLQYWTSEFDWSAREAELNALPQFKAEIEGQCIHFLHVRSREPDAMPLLLIHGFPWSITEFSDLLGPLSDPRAHNGSPKDAFHIVVPSVPGFGFSAPLIGAAWDAARISSAFADLMRWLGYGRFAIHGAESAVGIIDSLASAESDAIIGNFLKVRTNIVCPVSEGFDEGNNLSQEPHVVASAQGDLAGRRAFHLESAILSAGLTDSPILQLAWLAQNVAGSRGSNSLTDRDGILTDACVYWFTETGHTATRLCWEIANSIGARGAGVELPAAAAGGSEGSTDAKAVDVAVSGNPLVADIRAFFSSLRL
ncbi:epoxide hydrolase N-terminal domain-containing protein [Mycobacteroides abscessus]|uniref:epoxide hydrolase family protein n=1 Tax=Mycobacteroides abscessus TaxID=36809 RepID=UPI0034CD7622